MPAEILGKHYEGHFDEVSAAVFVVIPATGEVVSVNLEAEELTGYDKAELGKMAFWGIFRPEDRQRIRAIIDGSAKSPFQKLYEHNVIIQKRSKRPIFVDMGFRLSRLQGHEVFIFTLQDITEIKTHERKAVEAHRALANVIQSVREMLVVIDADGAVASANPATVAMLRGEEGALVGAPARTMFWEPDAFDRVLASLRAGTVVPESEFALRATDGTRVPVLLSASPLSAPAPQGGSAGARPRFVLAAMDLTERQKAERVIAEQQMIIVQAAKMSELGEMASGIAHEINNPLHIISGRCEMMGLFLGHAPLPLADIKESLAVIEGMASRIQRIVHGLQALSRDASKDPMEAAPVGRVLADALTLCEQRLRKSGIALSLPAFDEAWRVACWPTMLAQVFLNLLNNAHDALKGVPDPRVTVSVAVGGDHVEVGVANNGPAIPPALREKIFQPFFTTKPVGKGTGLGLSVSRSIVESHGGTLSLDPAADHPRFVIRLPRAAAVPSSPRQAS